MPTPGLQLSEEQQALTLSAIKFRIAVPWERPLTDEQLAAVTAPLMVRVRPGSDLRSARIR
ncbi:hypothetical protein [Nocardia sp. NPDC051981]|uniref:hypothetical protein n=1 Tax=Nocardia sp. NPDC051981 TaxID=3155417 RepID=UPI00341CD963